MQLKSTGHKKLNVVLVEPEIPQNTGNIARTCAAVGASLHLIEPLGFKITDKNLKRAGLDYWHFLDIKYYKSFEDFASRNQGDFYFYSTKATMEHTAPCYKDNDNVYLIFGKETAGLPEELLKANIDKTVRIPMLENIRSLNLSNSVAIGVYEVLRQWSFSGFQIQGKLAEYSE
ncbi:MAG: tRNA (uridine(34)/cytosine(34)/5-carboxymethylaminomethyluridine(34)-2'-O)-methyltransferase TrmL [Ruminococcaceae bacterium]|nr:tRNA (uridine(34)/cytosine(34)/5-carboxymethylaminomethyluridine(34)-2'-O)-methyltransferase TrmL [Oscillospiraceae bacterium]